MIQYKKLMMTLVLLMTAATGAWAKDVTENINLTTATVNGKNVTVSANEFNAYTGAALNWNNGRLTVSTKDGSNIIQVVLNIKSNANKAGDVTSSVGTCTVDGSKITATGINASSVTFSNTKSSLRIGSVEVTYVGPDPGTMVLSDAKTEATMEMPAYDVTVNYMLVRDMQDQANPVAFSGLPTNDEPIIVKKGDDGKYQPAEALNLQLIDPLAATDAQNIIASDGITVKVLVGDGGTPIEYDQENPITLEAFLADMKPGYYWIKAEQTDENSPYDGTVYSSEFTVVEQYDLVVKPANDFSKGKIENVTVGTEEITPDATTGKATKSGIDPGTEVKIKAKRGYIIEKVETGKGLYTMLNAATAEDIGMVVCNKGHLHDAKTAVPAGCTAVGILGKVTTTGHGLILALQDATAQTWDAINGWASASYASTTLKVLPNDAARGTNLTSYSTLGETAVSNWAVAQKNDYLAILTNLGSTANINGTTYDGNVNAYITTGVGGTALSGRYWTATKYDSFNAWYFDRLWDGDAKSNSHNVRPVLGF